MATIKQIEHARKEQARFTRFKTERAERERLKKASYLYLEQSGLRQCFGAFANETVDSIKPIE